jgi:hypothetical protein
MGHFSFALRRPRIPGFQISYSHTASQRRTNECPRLASGDQAKEPLVLF